MRRLWRALTSFVLSGGIMLLARWSMRVSRPADDLQVVRRAWWRVEEWARDCWTILWRTYGPVTSDMRTAWERLRERYRGGAFGVEGT